MAPKSLITKGRQRSETEAEAKRKEEAIVAPIIREGESILKREKATDIWATATLAGKSVKVPDSQAISIKEFEAAKAHLSSIKQNQPSYQKAQTLLAEIVALNNKGIAAAPAFDALAKTELRKDFASSLEQSFTENRMNTDVFAEGPKNTILRIKWVLASKVTANDFSKSGIIEKARKVGFTKIIFTDGYDSSWSWTLTPKTE